MWLIHSLAILLTVLIFLAGMNHRILHSLRPLLSASSSISLNFTTRELDGPRFWILFIGFILRSISRRIGLIRSHDLTKQLPQGDLTVPFNISEADLNIYRLAADLDETYDIIADRLHVQLLLSALTEPAMLLLLARKGCPIDPVGSVNVRNQFHLFDEESLISSLKQDMEKLAASKLRVTARFVEKAELVKRGWEVKIQVDLILETREKEQKLLYRQTFTMLQFAKHQKTPRVSVPKTWNDNSVNRAPSTANKEDSHSNQSFPAFSISVAGPQAWASLSKDHNPIHTSRFAAKVLGFRTTIAHGNHAAAKAITALGGPRTLINSSMIEVEFRRPIFLPAKLSINMESFLGGRTGEQGCIYSEEKTCVIIRGQQ